MEDTGEREASRRNEVWPRAWAMVVPATAMALMVITLGGGAACGREGVSERNPAVETPAELPAGAVRWRFVPTLEQHLPAGAVGATVLELSQPRQRTVVILAAVLRAQAEHVELERWTFAQSPDGQSLDLVEGGEPMVRLRPGTRNPKLTELQRELAAPGVVLTRPIGLPGEDDPGHFLRELATAFANLRDAKAEPRERVHAAAVVVRGLDDTVVFERDAIGEVAEVLDPLPNELVVQVLLGGRRARAKLPHAGGTAVLELQRKSDGWAITALERQDGGGVGTAAQPQ